MKGLFLCFTLLFLFNYFCFAQNSVVDESILNEALSASGDNRQELNKVLKHFSSDKEKLAAAKFLIAYTEYHYFRDEKKFSNPNIANLLRLADKLYYELVKDKSLEVLKSKDFKASLDVIKKQVDIKKNQLSFVQQKQDLEEAVKVVSSVYLIEQIEHAFKMRASSPLLKELAFEDFCEYVLPYENTVGYPIKVTNKKVFDFFMKYLPKPNQHNLSEVVEYYIVTLDNFRYLLGDYPVPNKLGFEELFFTKVPDWNCFDVSSFGAFVFNALGIPTVVEYYNGYKTLYGKHSYNKFITTKNQYREFSLEGSWEDCIPKIVANPKGNDGETLNRYRYHYSLQQNNPYSLSSEEEIVPVTFSHPLITEETRGLVTNVYTVKIPVPKSFSNHLVYLNTLNTDLFNVPMTWGKVDKVKGEATFENVIAERLYFPTYYNIHGQEEPFDYPFQLIVDKEDSTQFKVVQYNISKSVVNTRIDRIRDIDSTLTLRSNHFNGSYVLGADNPYFKNSDTIFRLNEALGLGYHKFHIDNKKEYKYYRFYQPKNKEKKHIEISEIRFLTESLYNYENTTPVSEIETDKVRLLEDHIDNLNKRWEYDGKFSTMINYPSLTFPLKQPQVVTGIILSIYIEDKLNPLLKQNVQYSLYEWDNGVWINKGLRTPINGKLDYESLIENKLYLLKESEGKDKNIPFTMNEKGKINFIYSH